MPLKTVHYQRLETEDSDGEEDEAPPTHVELHSSHNVKGEGGWFVIKVQPADGLKCVLEGRQLVKGVCLEWGG